MSRGWTILLLVLWAPIVVGGVILLFSYEGELNAIPYSTGPRVLFMLLLLASLIAVPLLLPSSYRTWTLFPDRIEIRQRPVIPLFGVYRRARLSFDEIAAARMGEALSTMSILELQSRSGARYRLAPRHIGKGKEAHIDEAGFHAFVESIRATIVASGTVLPPGEELHLPSGGFVGIVSLGSVCALLGAIGLAGLVIASDGELVGLQLIMFVTPFLLLFGGLFLARWRKWRASTMFQSKGRER